MNKRYPLKQIRHAMTSTDLRGAFTDALSAYELWEDGEPEPTIELGPLHVPITAACRLLSDYSDIHLPSACPDQAVLRLALGRLQRLVS